MTVAERLGKYELVRHLASGGMARVFLARMTGVGGFERHLVLKVVRPERSEDASFVTMFLDEARLAATLYHQHIAQVYEVGVADDGTYFLAMEYVHGQTVRAVLEAARTNKTRIPYDFALTVVGAAAAGLHHAHERRDADGKRLGIVHRDVSPSNIIVGYDGSVKLIDFGIAKARERGTNTKTGYIKGKAGYMAPEQAVGDPIDHRADVFSLGVVLYELTTQIRAFPAASEIEVAHRTVRGEVRLPSSVIPGFPPVLEDIIMTALSPDPDDRFPDVRTMAVGITAAADLLGVTQRSAAVSELLAGLFGRPVEPWLELGRPDVDLFQDLTPDTASLLERPAHLRAREPGRSGTLSGPFARVSGEVPIGRAIGPRAARTISKAPGASLVRGTGRAAAVTVVTQTAARPSGAISAVDREDVPTARFVSIEPRDAGREPTPPRVHALGTQPPPPVTLPGVSPRPAASRPRMALPPGIDPRAFDPAAPPAVPPVIRPPRPPVRPPAAARPTDTLRGLRPPEPPGVAPKLPAIAVPIRVEAEMASAAIVRPRARPRWFAPVAIGATIAGVVVAIAIVDHAAPRPAAKVASPSPRVFVAPPPPAPAPPSPPPAAVEPAKVTLRITTDPPGATVLLDGERLGPAPVTIAVQREAREARLKARKRGYLPRTILIPLGADGDWTVRLLPDPSR